MKKLTLAMIVKNESAHLARCLQSVSRVVDEIVIVDTGSTDETKSIAASFGAKLFDYEWNDHFADARNYALQQSTGDWNLILDADEWVDGQSLGELRSFIEHHDHAAGRLNIINKFDQNGQDSYSHTYVTRLIPHDIWFEGRIHEQVASPYPRINTNIIVHHDGYYKQDKSDRNLELLRTALRENPEDPYMSYQLAKQYKLMKKYMKATAYFDRSYSYISNNAAYRPDMVVDSLQNLLSAKMFERALEIVLREQGRYADYPDFRFFCGVFYMELVFYNMQKYGSYFERIEQEYLACLQIGETDRYSGVEGTGSFMAAFNLGVYYETTGDMAKALHYYQLSASLNYQPAMEKLAAM